jgi:hypothetical protein
MSITIENAREVFSVFTAELGLSFDVDSANTLFSELTSGAGDISLDIDGEEYRLVADNEIDSIMQEELESDLYCLGGCNAWFIADMTDLDTDTIQKAQGDGSFELLGALLAKDIEAVQEAIVSADSYGPHFNHYDGSEYEAGGWRVFRTN